MAITTWVTFVTVISALIIIPGPSSLLITMHGAHYGYGKANYTIFGNLLGSLILMTLSAAGLSTLLLSSEIAFSIAKYIGAAYLIFLGIKSILSASKNLDSDTTQLSSNVSRLSLLRSGFFTGISNPKDLIFFASLFPAFLSSDYPIANQLMILMATWLLVDYLLKLVYVLAGGKIRRLFASTTFKVWFNRLTGGLFIGFGSTLAAYNKQ